MLLTLVLGGASLKTILACAYGLVTHGSCLVLVSTSAAAVSTPLLVVHRCVSRMMLLLRLLLLLLRVAVAITVVRIGIRCTILRLHGEWRVLSQIGEVSGCGTRVCVVYVTTHRCHGAMRRVTEPGLVRSRGILSALRCDGLCATILLVGRLLCRLLLVVIRLTGEG